MKALHLRRGRRGEHVARRWLEARGLVHLISNYCCNYGELDLVMLDADCLVIVEVRFRTRSTFGTALETITRSKQQRIMRATEHFLQQHREYRHRPLRFDALGLTYTGGRTRPDWRRNAFAAGDD